MTATPLDHHVGITPLPLGLFTVPGSEIAKYPGVTVKAPYVVCAYLVRAPGLTLLFDTGIVGDSGAIEHYRPRSLSLVDQLAAAGCERSDIDVVANCHLHCDHSGGNHLFGKTPIFVQEAELHVARDEDYTVVEACVDFPGASFVPVRGKHQIAPGITVLPTFGHSPGHQSLLVTGTADGTVLLAGQAFDSASDFATAALAHQLGGEIDDVTAPGWVEDLMSQDIDVVRFAHDMAQWRPPTISYRGSGRCTPWGEEETSAATSARRG